MEPAVNSNVVAALYSPDAGNLIPYEYTIALLENAVDNGVEVRIRREVTAIDAPAEGMVGDGISSLFAVTCKYWEPSSYIKASGGKDAILSSGSASSPRQGVSILSVIAPASFVISMLALSAGGSNYGLLPWALAYANLDPSFIIASIIPGQHSPFVAVSFLSTILSLALSLVITVITYSLRSFGRRSDSSPAHCVKAPIGTGGRIVSVDEMRKGGSGSCDAMKGETVAQEVYRARFIVNCAGSYADVIAGVSSRHFYICC
jgi:hypothetical protein